MSRRYLSEAEVQRILDIASPHSLRNYCMIYLAFIHGLRVSELISLQLTDYDPLASTLSIRRLKGGLSTIHPLSTEGSRIIRQWLQERSDSSPAENPWFFPSYNNTHITRQRFWQIIRAYGDMAGLTVRAHPHMLRHACGFALAERGNGLPRTQKHSSHRPLYCHQSCTLSSGMAETSGRNSSPADAHTDIQQQSYPTPLFYLFPDGAFTIL